MTPELWILRGAEAPWGDYGSILYNGDGSHGEDGRFRLRRTGPVVPPISFAGAIIIRDALRRELERAPFEPPELVPVVKVRIVRIPWHEWDPSDEPRSYPESGEPVGYLSEYEHDPTLSDEIGDLWEVRAAIVPGIQLEKRRVDARLYAGQPLVRTGRWGHDYVPTMFKTWLEERVGDWVDFEPAPLA